MKKNIEDNLQITLIKDSNKIIGPNKWADFLIGYLNNKNINAKIINATNINFLSNLKVIFKSNIIHFFVPSPQTLFYFIISSILNKKKVFTLHGFYNIEAKSKPFYKKYLWNLINYTFLIKSDKITVPSLKLKEYLFKIGFNRDIILISNGIDIKKINNTIGYKKKDLGLKKNNFLIVEITSFHSLQKAEGIDLLVQDFSEFQKRKKNSYLFIIGGGKLLEDYKKKYESERIRFLGFKRDAISYIKACDLFVHYSFLDSFGIVLLEALACNKPVIAYGTSPFSKILGKSIRLKNLNKKNLSKILYNQKNIVKKYDIEYIGNKFIELYKQVIEEYKKKKKIRK